MITKRISGRASVAAVGGSRGSMSVAARPAAQPAGSRPSSAAAGEEALASVGAPLSGPISPIREPQLFDPPGGPHG